MVTKIWLSQSNYGLKDVYALVDDEDAERLNEYRWHRVVGKNTTYASRIYGPKGKQKHIGMHTQITGNELTDHINGNGLDNRRENLRCCTQQQNTYNRIKQRSNTSSTYKGIYWNKRGQKWQACVQVPVVSGGGRRKSLGYFADEIEAARAYDAAAREYYGEFAALNFPRPGERSALTGEIIPLESEAA